MSLLYLHHYVVCVLVARQGGYKRVLTVEYENEPWYSQRSNYSKTGT